MLQVTILAAPTAHVAEDMPALIAMRNSQRVDMDKVIAQTKRNIERIQEQTANWLRNNKAAYDTASQQRYESARTRAAANRKAMSQSTSAFIDYISDQSVVTDPDGTHRRMDSNLASALEKADPQHFRVIPAKEYIPGIDY